jgi:hypothetical protein
MVVGVVICLEIWRYRIGRRGRVREECLCNERVHSEGYPYIIFWLHRCGMGVLDKTCWNMRVALHK